MYLEVCAATYESVVNAQKAGAYRIELCQNLDVGGLTPSAELIKTVITQLDLPVFVLIRPRSGDFVYNNEEFETMLESIEMAKFYGCQGIVSGVLNSNNEIDNERTKALIEKSFPLPFTFHRAFDHAKNPLASIELIKSLGARRVLTSGQAVSAELGIDLLNQLKGFDGPDFNVLPGGGINPSNAQLFKVNGFQEIHASGISRDRTPSTPNNEMSLISAKKGHSSFEILSDILEAIKD